MAVNHCYLDFISLLKAFAHPAGRWSSGQQPCISGANGTACTSATDAWPAKSAAVGSSEPAPIQTAKGRHDPGDGAPLLRLIEGQELLTMQAMLGGWMMRLSLSIIIIVPVHPVSERSGNYTPPAHHGGR